MNLFWKKTFWKKIEHYNAKLMPYAILTLLLVIVFEFFRFFIFLENNILELIINILDFLAIAIFIVDLIFIAVKARSIKYFFRNYWLDVIAVFPFVLFFEAINSFYRIIIATERFAVGQKIVHEAVEAGREAEIIAKTGGKAGKFIRIIARSIRVVTKSRFFSRFKATHRQAKKRLKGKRRH